MVETDEGLEGIVLFFEFFDCFYKYGTKFII